MDFFVRHFRTCYTCWQKNPRCKYFLHDDDTGYSSAWYFFLVSFTFFKVKLNAIQKGKYYNVKKRVINYFKCILIGTTHFLFDINKKFMQI
ncbi:hypothetical protein EDC94DRAFT_594419 [Helicostylum pulchrum]|nr:hypothetical protein EDC94DRAFT_594419 [Helicostylum pulchrum]